MVEMDLSDTLDNLYENEGYVSTCCDDVLDQTERGYSCPRCHEQAVMDRSDTVRGNHESHHCLNCSNEFVVK